MEGKEVRRGWGEVSLELVVCSHDELLRAGQAEITLN